MEKNFTHLDKEGNPQMVDVGKKSITERTAKATCTVVVPQEIIALFENDEIHTKKGPVFQTAILAGIMAIKKTAELIPLCHPLALSSSNVNIWINEQKQIEIESEVKLSGKTGVEMEALTGASVAALTIYDMCKGFSHDIQITNIQLKEKTGGKNDFKRA